MTEQPPPQPGQGYLLPEEDTAHLWRDVGEGMSHAPDDEVLKGGGLLDEGRLLVLSQEVALVDEGRR